MSFVIEMKGRCCSWRPSIGDNCALAVAFLGRGIHVTEGVLSTLETCTLQMVPQESVNLNLLESHHFFDSMSKLESSHKNSLYQMIICTYALGYFE